ncbi:arsenate reductase (glutaredoxin) [Flavobacterium sp. UMI-01]|nr:arsenate reductase (glutaredoxin) [Flavobacterium sp. UMI-01]
MDDNNLNYEIIKYLETPPTEEELKVLLEKLNLTPLQIIRQKEKIWIENYKNKSLSDEELIKILVAHPILIERPIVISENKAIIGREFDKLESFITNKS